MDSIYFQKVLVSQRDDGHTIVCRPVFECLKEFLEQQQPSSPKDVLMQCRKRLTQIKSYE